MLEQENAMLELQNRCLEADPTLTQHDSQALLVALAAKSYSIGIVGSRSRSLGGSAPAARREPRSARTASSSAQKSHHKVASPSKKRGVSAKQVVAFLICACQRRAAQRIFSRIEAAVVQSMRVALVRLRVRYLPQSRRHAFPATHLVAALRFMEHQKQIESAHRPCLPGSEEILETILQDIERYTLNHIASTTSPAATMHSEDNLGSSGTVGRAHPQHKQQMQLGLASLRAFMQRKRRQVLGSYFAWLHCWAVEQGLQPEGLASLLLLGPSAVLREHSNWKVPASQLSPLSPPDEPVAPTTARHAEVSELEYDPVEGCFVQHSVFFANGKGSCLLPTRTRPAPSSARLRFQHGSRTQPLRVKDRP